MYREPLWYEVIDSFMRLLFLRGYAVSKKDYLEKIWDFWCIISIVGIWPRFIEPNLLRISRLSLKIPHLPVNFNGLKILHFSDLHWSGSESIVIRKLINQTDKFRPDFIFFTGDFLSCARLHNPMELKILLNRLRSTYGSFAVLGNHDYSHFVTVNVDGDYDLADDTSSSKIIKGLKRLFRPINLTKRVTPRAQAIPRHEALMDLLRETSFRVLDNTVELVSCRGSRINVCGLGEYSLGQCKPEVAFRDYDCNYPGVILSHNPDSLEILKNYPGSLVLAGHTHGGQINLPGLWKRFTYAEHPEFKRGLKKFGEKWAYINRGISSLIKFRWFSAPELTLITLK